MFHSRPASVSSVRGDERLHLNQRSRIVRTANKDDGLLDRGAVVPWREYER